MSVTTVVYRSLVMLSKERELKRESLSHISPNVSFRENEREKRSGRRNVRVTLVKRRRLNSDDTQSVCVCYYGECRDK